MEWHAPPSMQQIGPLRQQCCVPTRTRAQAQTHTEGPPRREARAHGEGMQVAVGALSATPSCCMFVACLTRLLKPVDGAYERQNSWFGRTVVGHGC